MKSIFIVDAIRTPMGNMHGSLASVPAHKLGEIVIRELLKRTGVPASCISEVIMGQVLTSGQGQNPARQAAINAGLPVEVPAWLVNQVCGSGLKSVMLGYQSILTSNSSIVIAGGQENMSMAQHSAYLRSGAKFGDIKLVDTMLHDGLTDAFKNYSMGITAENIAKKFNISRQDQDKFACASQNKAEAAQKNGFFKGEIVPVKIEGKKETVVFEEDEYIRYGTTIESLNKLRPAFDKEGTVTAGNSSGINDGAAAVMLMDEESVTKYNVTPIARIVSIAQAGVDPEIMGIGPVPAVKKALNAANWTIGDLDLIGSNEAFAAQVIAVDRSLGWDTSKINITGGAIALGHPIGASGTRVLVTLLHNMKRTNAKKGVATLCVGGGMGVAMCVELL